MDNSENVTELHYKMLNFLYDKQSLPSSCFAYCWEDFKTENVDIHESAGM